MPSFSTPRFSQKAVFFDRDGTLIVEKHYLKDPNLVELEPTTIDALLLLQKHGFLLFIVTNQSGIARGYFNTYAFLSTQNRLLEILRQAGVRITDFWYCPHLENGPIPRFSISCSCRKPKPGMLLEAISTYHLDPQLCWMIGDKFSDIEAGRLAQFPHEHCLHVQTGHGREVFSNTPTFSTLLDSATHIISCDSPSLQTP